MNDKIFWDSNLWIYLFLQSQNPIDINKKSKLVSLLRANPSISSSVQVMNEVTNVLLRKYKCSETDMLAFLQQIDNLTNIISLTKDLSFEALRIKFRYQLSWFDSLVVAASLKADCKYLYSEDLHHGLVIDNKLIIQNPFL